MPAIQRLYEACKVSFSPSGPVSAEALENVCAMLGEMEYFILLVFFQSAL